MTAQLAIRVHQLAFSYDGEEPSLEDVSFEVGPGQTLGLVGSNGSGKSTLLAILAGLFTPTAGSVSLGEARNDGDTSGHVVSPGAEDEIRGLTGLVQQDVDLQILGATVEEDLLLGRPPTRERVDAARSLAERFGLLDAWETPVQTLSWGQKRKLCISAVLMNEPGLLLLDEPFSGLDYPSILEMRRILQRNRDGGINQVVAVHDLDPVADLVDRWVVLSKGRLVLAGEASDVFDRLKEFSVRAPHSWRSGKGIQPWE